MGVKPYLPSTKVTQRQDDPESSRSLGKETRDPVLAEALATASGSLRNVPAEKLAAELEVASDNVLMLLFAKEGRSDALAKLVDKHSPGLLAYLTSRGGREEAEDAIQQAFLRIMEKKNVFDPARGDFLPWLYTIARNIQGGFFRSKLRRPALTDSGNLAEIPVEERTEEFVAISECLARLPWKHREVLELLFFSGLTEAQAAQVLDTSESTVSNRKQAALKRLRQIVTK